MESLKELYKIGTGPSSSHTMGPKKAAEAFVKRASDADRYKVTLYGSLAATGKGHMTDVAILSVLEPVAPTEIVWRPDISLPFHPNGMRFEAFKAGKPVDEWVIYSVGGGALANEETAKNPPANIYPMTHISEILEWCNREGQTFWEYVEECEGPGIWDYLDEIWTAMCETIVRGLTAEGVLPGGLKVSRKASTYLVKAESYTDTLRSRAKLYAYALATAEENASGGTVVTAPTCGSSAVHKHNFSHFVFSPIFMFYFTTFRDIGDPCSAPKRKPSVFLVHLIQLSRQNASLHICFLQVRPNGPQLSEYSMIGSGIVLSGKQNAF